MKSNFKADDVIERLQLEPLAFEGGYFKRTYLSDDVLSKDELPNRYPSGKNKHYASAIYYLLTPSTYSKIHRLPTDEIFHFYLGSPVEIILINEHDEVKIVKLGSELFDGFVPQVIVPKGTWQGCRLIDDGEFALLGTTMSPAFDLEDFEVPEDCDLFLKKFKGDEKELIRKLL